MAQNGTESLTPPGSERTQMERLAIQWPHLSRNLFPEGRDCYGDPERAAYVEASYAPITDAVAEAAAGDPVLLIGRQTETYRREGVARIIALGELAGDGSGVMLGFREGEIVLPTSHYGLLVRHSISRMSGYRPPALHRGALRSGIAVANEGLLPPKEDLMDNALYTKLPPGGRSDGLRSNEEEEMWGRTADIAVGHEAVEALMTSMTSTGSRLSRNMFRQDFAALQDLFAGSVPELLTMTEAPAAAATG